MFQSCKVSEFQSCKVLKGFSIFVKTKKMTEINNYQESIKREETFDFLLGKNKYINSDRERAGMHDMSLTYYYIKEYGKIVGNEKLLFQLKKDIKMILEKDLTPYELSMIIGYLYLYQRDSRDLLFTDQWIIEDKIKQQIRQKLNLFEIRFTDENKELDYTKKEYSHGYFLYNCKFNLDKLKEHFDIII